MKYSDLEEFPVLSTDIPSTNKQVSIFDWIEYIERDLGGYDKSLILAGDIKEIDTVEDYIIFGKEVGVTHLVIDGKSAQPNVLNDIFSNEKNYPYLLIQFDSAEHGFIYHMKVYEIDFHIFEKYLENNK